MKEEKNKKTLEVLTKINSLLDEVRDLFPPPNQIMNPTIKAKPTNNENYPLKILKRVNGIIKGFNEENAERKLKNLVALLSSPNIVALVKKKEN